MYRDTFYAPKVKFDHSRWYVTVFDFLPWQTICSTRHTFVLRMYNHRKPLSPLLLSMHESMLIKNVWFSQVDLFHLLPSTSNKFKAISFSVDHYSFFLHSNIHMQFNVCHMPHCNTHETVSTIAYTYKYSGIFSMFAVSCVAGSIYFLPTLNLRLYTYTNNVLANMKEKNHE